MTKTARTLMLTVGLLFALCLALMIALDVHGIKIMFALFALVFGALLLWLVIRALRGWAQRKNAHTDTPRFSAATGPADEAFGVPASTACAVDSDLIRRAQVSKAESEGNALSASANPTAAQAEIPGEDDRSASAKPAASAPPREKSAPATGAPYIGHMESKKFHVSACQTLPMEKNRVYFQSREEAVSKGYTPCSYCEP
jgi:hypothetical protein